MYFSMSFFLFIARPLKTVTAQQNKKQKSEK